MSAEVFPPATTALESMVRQLLDREAIREALHRYCRGVDRVDVDAIRSAYWPDAEDHHGEYVGGPEGLIERVIEGYSPTDHVVHSICNTSIALRGDQADVEAYFIALHALEVGEDGVRIQTFLAGRYLDVFEKRAEEWRVLRRTVVYDWIRKSRLVDGLGEAAFSSRQPVGLHAPHDLVYEFESLR
ncbi:nuclear transport factor 2 family protein [Saccharomonospora sp. NPDC046836]|uniref:nuclear transport factor 2 family protein n=1 Tax=Saccharomonospora sp. NPDC046836 TaxID=3156921 RepID=UPI003403A3CE